MDLGEKLVTNLFIRVNNVKQWQDSDYYPENKAFRVEIQL